MGEYNGELYQFMHTAFKAYCGVLLGPVWTSLWSATCDIGINTINSLVNVVKFAMDDWYINNIHSANGHTQVQLLLIKKKVTRPWLIN